MRPGQQQQQQQKNRMRGRGRKGPNPLSRSYESNGPDVKIRGNAQHIAEKYGMLARDASGSGDRVMAENYLQHAEHYNRIVAAAQGQFQPQRDDRDMRDGDEDDDDSQEYRNDERPASNGARDSDRDGYRDRDPSRDRDGNRDGNREQHRNRDSNRDRDSQRDNRDRDGRDRDANRDNRDRDGNRDNNRDRDGNRNGNRERRDRFQPQPAQESTGSGQGQPAARDEQVQAPARQVEEARHSDETVNAVAPSVDDQAPAPRRRGRPRRIRDGDEAVADDVASTPQADTAGERSEQHPAAQADAPESEAPVKRRPGRPRKKKPEEDSGGASDGEGNELPAFLLASNG